MNSDEILEKELLKKNLLTKEQLIECKEEQEKHPEKSLSEILLEKKWISQEQLMNQKSSVDKKEYEKALEDIEKVLSLQNSKEVPSHQKEEIRQENKEKLAAIKKTAILEKLPSRRSMEPKEGNSSDTNSQENISSLKLLALGEGGETPFSSLKKTKILEKMPSEKPLTKPLDFGIVNPSSGKKTTAFEMMSSNTPIDFEDEVKNAPTDSEKINFSLKMPAKEHDNASEKTDSKKKTLDPLLMNLPSIPDEDKVHKEENIDIPFGKACIILHFATEDQVQAALAEQSKNPGKTLGEIMVSMNILTPDKVKTILSRQKSQTLICYACNKKYQIVMYQAGRSYKCKICKRELEKFSETKARKRKEKLDLMGITQSVSLDELSKDKKIDTKGIDFAAGNQQEGENVLSTSDILKKVGVLGSRDYRKSIIPKKKMNYTRIFLILFMLSISIWFVSYLVSVFFHDIPKKIETKPIHYKKETKEYFPEEKKEWEESKKMELEFQRLIQVKYNEENVEGLKQEILTWQAFLNNYPQTPYRNKAMEKIYLLQDMLKKAIEKKNFFAFEQAFGVKMSIGDMAGAEKILLEHQKNCDDMLYQKQYIEKQKNLQAIAKNSMEKELAIASNLIQEKKFQEASHFLESKKKFQILVYAPLMQKKILEIKKIEESYLWGNIALQMSKKIYSSLMEKKFKEAISFLNKQKEGYPKYKIHFEKWIENLKKAEEFWKNCQKIFLRNKDKEMILEIVGQGEKKVIPKSFSPKTGSLVLLWENKFKNIKLATISSNTFKKLLLDKNFNKEKISQLGLFLFFIKDPESVQEGFPEIFEFNAQKQLFFVYTIASIYYFIDQKNFYPLENIFKYSKKHSSDISFFQDNKEEIAKKLWENAVQLEPKGRKKLIRDMLLRFILEYFENTVYFQQAKEARKY